MAQAVHQLAFRKNLNFHLDQGSGSAVSGDITGGATLE
ncbi:hypothetical protein BH10CYA1_BH10CYA1_07920 [soil metagenome]